MPVAMSYEPAAPYIKRSRSRLELLLGGQDPGKPGRITAGSYVSDLVALNKCLSLCALCVPRFDPTAVNYVTRASLPRAHGVCDGCGEWQNDNVLFFPAGQF